MASCIIFSGRYGCLSWMVSVRTAYNSEIQRRQQHCRSETQVSSQGSMSNWKSALGCKSEIQNNLNYFLETTRIDSHELFIFPLVIIYIYFSELSEARNKL